MRQPPSQFQSLESSDCLSCQATASLDPQELPLGKQCHGTGFVDKELETMGAPRMGSEGQA